MLGKIKFNILKQRVKNEESRNKRYYACRRTNAACIRANIFCMVENSPCSDCRWRVILRLISFKSDIHRIIAHVIGEMLIFWGIILIILSSIDYKKTRQKLMIASSYKSSPFGFVIIVFPLLIMCALLIWVTLP